MIAENTDYGAIIPDTVSHQLRYWTKLFAEELLRSGHSERNFGKLVGTDGPVINMTKSGKRSPPLEKIEIWANALDLHGERRAHFIEAAHLYHGPEEIENLVSSLRDQIAKLTSDRDKLRAQSAEICAQLRSLGVEPPKGFCK